ncbi:MAG: DNA phosphorothioation-associated protein 4 [Syntrophomonadaceae bacterium]|nr:DNA phosphorothioation-associated protein 4 [Syntrophomonadaceae bacterium]
MAWRFRRPKDKEHIFQSLVREEGAPFITFKDVMMMAACIGHKIGTRVQLPPGGEQIHGGVLDEDTDQAMIDIIALCETGDIEALLDDEHQTASKYSLFEEYCNAGLDVLKKEVLDAPGEPLDNLLALIFKEENQTPSVDRDILIDFEV